MTQKASRKELLKDDRLVESSVEITHWLDKHRTQLLQGAAALGALVLIAAAWTFWSASKRRDAQASFDEGLRLLRPMAVQGAPPSGKPEEALTAFEAAASKGGGSSTGLAARYYQGVCLVELGRAGEAVPLLESVAAKAGAGSLGDSARAMLAQAYEAAGSADKSEALWREMAAAEGGTFPQDVALLRVAELLHRQGKADEARRTYQEVVTRFPQGLGASQARAALAAGGQ